MTHTKRVRLLPFATSNCELSIPAATQLLPAYNQSKLKKSTTNAPDSLRKSWQSTETGSPQNSTCPLSCPAAANASVSYSTTSTVLDAIQTAAFFHVHLYEKGALWCVPLFFAHSPHKSNEKHTLFCGQQSRILAAASLAEASHQHLALWRPACAVQNFDAICININARHAKGVSTGATAPTKPWTAR